MRMLIEKIDSRGAKEIIESETYTAELIERPSKEKLQGVVSFLTNEKRDYITNKIDLQSVTAISAYGAVDLMEAFIPPIAKCVNTGGMYLIDSSKDILNGIIYPTSPEASRGIVGYVDLDWGTYAGNSTIYGTMNLLESTRNLGNRKQKHHIVIDFPTHSCNGNVDTIYITPYSYKDTSHNIYGIVVNRKMKIFQPNIIKFIGYISDLFTTDGILSVEEYITQQLYITQENMAIGVHPNVGVYVYKNGKIGIGKFNTIGSSYQYSIFEKDGKVYCVSGINNSKDINSIKVVEIVIKEESDKFIVTTGVITTMGGIGLTTDKFPGMGVYNIKRYGRLNERLQYFLYADSYYASAINKRRLTILDNDWNLVSSYDVSITDNSSYVFNDNDKKIHVIAGSVLNDKGEYLGTVTLRDKNLKSNGTYYTNGKTNWGIICSSDSIFRNDVTRTEIAPLQLIQVDTKLQAPIKITLKEPLKKNNAETLKLIFDFELEIT